MEALTASEREVVLLLSDDGIGSISTNSPLWRKRLPRHLGAASDSSAGWARWEVKPEQFVMQKRGK